MVRDMRDIFLIDISPVTPTFTRIANKGVNTSFRRVYTERVHHGTRRGVRARPKPSWRTGKRQQETKNNRGRLEQGPPGREVLNSVQQKNINKDLSHVDLLTLIILRPRVGLPGQFLHHPRPVARVPPIGGINGRGIGRHGGKERRPFGLTIKVKDLRGATGADTRKYK